MSAHSEESFIKTPRQLIVVGILAFVIPVAIALIAALLVTKNFFPDQGGAQQREASIKPAGGFTLLDVNAPSLQRAPAKP